MTTRKDGACANWVERRKCAVERPGRRFVPSDPATPLAPPRPPRRPVLPAARARAAAAAMYWRARSRAAVVLERCAQALARLWRAAHASPCGANQPQPARTPTPTRTLRRQARRFACRRQAVILGGRFEADNRPVFEVMRELSCGRIGLGVGRYRPSPTRPRVGEGVSDQPLFLCLRHCLRGVCAALTSDHCI